ncbi:MAG: SPOR domain-containing protein, partial [Candidatus Competibacterales bacterium]
PTESTPSVQLDYWVQAGSFRRQQDADRRRAQLAKLGFSSFIQTVEHGGAALRRVRLGPFDRRRAQRIEQRLKANGIDALALRR